MRELYQRIDAAELTEWYILEHLEPWGQTAMNLMLAQLCAVVANSSMNRAPGAAHKLADYLPKQVEPPLEMIDQESIAGFFMNMAKRGKKK